jgi:hypothetical protein
MTVSTTGHVTNLTPGSESSSRDMDSHKLMTASMTVHITTLTPGSDNDNPTRRVQRRHASMVDIPPSGVPPTPPRRPSFSNAPSFHNGPSSNNAPQLQDASSLPTPVGRCTLNYVDP